VTILSVSYPVLQFEERKKKKSKIANSWSLTLHQNRKGKQNTSKKIPDSWKSQGSEHAHE
jgi:hypothetical protein